MSFSSDEVKSIYDSVLADRSLLASINPKDYLDAVENKNNVYLENKKSSTIVDEIAKSFDELGDDDPKFKISKLDASKGNTRLIRRMLVVSKTQLWRISGANGE